MSSALLELDMLARATGEPCDHFQHVAFGLGSQLLTRAASGPVTLAEHDIPAAHCLIVSRVDLDVMPQDTETARPILSRKSTLHNAPATELYFSDGNNPLTPRFSSAAGAYSYKLLANVPLLLLFTGRMSLKLLARYVDSDVQKMYFDARVNAYLAPASVAPKLKPIATRLNFK